ncbi:MAG: sigma 54-interacting transcriptional regulator [Deltaproteobacteria bacterium]|jgi:transcriptional regulator with PAS, ATPase and Fis domain|nr:sigma 54-interacting transcriptional regulator [Deltaproteobacteria bacterium]
MTSQIIPEPGPSWLPPHPKPEIGFVAPYQGLADLANEKVRQGGLPVTVRTGDLVTGYQVASQLASEGCRIFISRGGTALMIKKLGFPVVEIVVGPCDILDGLKAVSKNDSPVGLIGFSNILTGAERLASLLEINLIVVKVENEAEVPDKLKTLQRAGVRTVLGDLVVTDEASNLGLSAVLIESGPEAVTMALKEAVERLALLNWADEQNRGRLEALSQFKTVLENLEDPVLIVDSQGVVHVNNPAADRLWGETTDGRDRHINWTEIPAFSRAINTGLPQVDNVTVLGGQRYLLEIMPIAPPERPRNSPPVDSESLVAVIGRSAEKVEKSERRLRRATHLKGHVARFHFSDIITEDPHFQSILNKAAEYALTDLAILIQGESGTGKEMLAQSIHNHKFDQIRPFVALNCASLPATILESELFGYAPGTFTGALKEGKKGFFELAHGGTLFLDELGEMPLELQSRILRVIEEKAVLPLGADRLVPVEVRIIAATNKNLADSVRGGLFRKDLYFRLAILLLTIPPVRERGGDPLVLFRHLAANHIAGLDLNFLKKEEVRNQLVAHPWPGNAREIKNLVQRLAITTYGFTRNLNKFSELLTEELDASRLMTAPLKTLPQQADSESLSPRPKLKTDLAKALGISRTTLWRRQRRHLDPPAPPTLESSIPEKAPYQLPPEEA